jgi:hypothetical protein
MVTVESKVECRLTIVSGGSPGERFGPFEAGEQYGPFEAVLHLFEHRCDEERLFLPVPGDALFWHGVAEVSCPLGDFSALLHSSRARSLMVALEDGRGGLAMDLATTSGRELGDGHYLVALTGVTPLKQPDNG